MKRVRAQNCAVGLKAGTGTGTSAKPQEITRREQNPRLATCRLLWLVGNGCCRVVYYGVTTVRWAATSHQRPSCQAHVCVKRVRRPSALVARPVTTPVAPYVRTLISE